MGEQHKMLLNIINAIRSADGRVTPTVIQAIGRSVLIHAGKAAQLYENGGPILLNYEWACRIIAGMGWTERKSTIARKLIALEMQETAKKRR